MLLGEWSGLNDDSGTTRNTCIVSTVGRRTILVLVLGLTDAFGQTAASREVRWKLLSGGSSRSRIRNRRVRLRQCSQAAPGNGTGRKIGECSARGEDGGLVNLFSAAISTG